MLKTSQFREEPIAVTAYQDESDDPDEEIQKPETENTETGNTEN